MRVAVITFHTIGHNPIVVEANTLTAAYRWLKAEFTMSMVADNAVYVHHDTLPYIGYVINQDTLEKIITITITGVK